MSNTYKTANGSGHWDHLNIYYNTSADVDSGGLEVSQPLETSIAIEDLPTAEATAFVLLRTYMENKCKTDCETAGVTFEN